MDAVSRRLALTTAAALFPSAMYYGRTKPRPRKRRIAYGPGPLYRGPKRKYYGPRYRMGGYGSEIKFADSEVTSTALSVSWVTLNPTTKDSLSSVAQGTTESQHLGRTMYITSLHLRIEFFIGSTESQVAPIDDEIVRFAIVRDTDTKGSEVTATDVMDAGQSNDVLAFRNLQHTSRLFVHHDKTFIMRSHTTNEGALDKFAAQQRIRFFKVNLTFKKPIRVLFSGTTAVVASIVDNSFHFICISSAVNVNVTYQCRLRFKDTL